MLLVCCRYVGELSVGYWCVIDVLLICWWVVRFHLKVLQCVVALFHFSMGTTSARTHCGTFK